MIKKKSLIVAFASSLVVASVLVLTLVGYAVYMELKGEESRRIYDDLLQKLNAKVYSPCISVSGLEARIDTSGALKGKPIVAGVMQNNGNRDISGILIKVKLIDKDGAVLYEIVFYPNEPSLGSSVIPRMSIPYLSGPPKITLKPKSQLPFKRILSDCPGEITEELNSGRGAAKGKWSGRPDYEILAISFQ
jgi:hypothetical protein